jgi:hypothetical protein
MPSVLITLSTRAQSTLLGKLSCHPFQFDCTIVTNSWQAHVNRTAAIDYAYRVGRTISGSVACSQFITILVPSTKARPISNGVTLAVECIVGTAIDERAADLSGAFGDDADAVDALA